ncbi:hypothetical protein [Shinella sp.]|uniref:hypothetical protein n=1 Tax=Shinella sp. TaxID=1870904 RepID=UPI0028AB8272|nr:hypothetical protein [Shinella sp.]
MTDNRPLETRDFIIIAVAVSSVLYNGVLALINAHVMPLGFAHVALTEILILFAGLLYILRKGLYEEDIGVLLFTVFTLVMAIYMSAINRMVFVDYFRNILIIFCFATLGTWSNRATVKAAFLLSLGAVMAVLLCEIFSLTLYADLFKPGYYFLTTRGLEPPEWDKTGLFGNALGFKGRLSFGLIGHRASSLFLEQVSLSNFGGVMMMYTLFFWDEMKRGMKLWLVACIVLILLTTASRTMLTFAAVCVGGYFVFPRVPKLVSLVTMPLILLAGTTIFMLNPNATGDNLNGRIVVTMRHVSEMDVFGFLGFYATKAAYYADSGYVYIIYGGTIFAMIAFWLFVSLYPAGDTPAQRRLAQALPIFLFFNLMIGATPVFTAKIAGLMWLLVGYARQQTAPRIMPTVVPASTAALPRKSLS